MSITKVQFLQSLPNIVGFEGDDDPDAAAAAAAAAAGGDPKTYTQEEFDAHMAGLRRKYDTKEATHVQAQKELAIQLEKAKGMKGLSDEEKTALETRIQELESEYLTDKEKAERAAAQERETFTGQIETLTGETTRWRSNYEAEVVKNGIRAAAAEHKAYDRSGDQIAAILGPMVEFKEVLDDDEQPTGNVKPVIRFPDVDTKTKEPIVLDYTIGEAVKRMTELDKHGNLFEDTMRSGIGGGKNGGTPTGKIDIAKIAKEDPAAYRKLRKESPELIAKALQGRS